MKPPEHYGVLEQRPAADALERAVEDITCLGYAVVDSGYPAGEIAALARAFDETHQRYVQAHGEAFLREIDEHNGIRLPLALDARFLDLAMNPRILEIASRLIRNQFILNQQNGIINPPGERYNQGAWHRDLPYQHFVASRPLAINALYCIDEFTSENGATFVLPGSHLQEPYPSDAFIEREARQIAAPAGSFIVLHGMLFHRGGPNRTRERRRAVNHVYSVAFVRQQIDMRAALGDTALPPQAAQLLGLRYQIPRTVSEFLKSRKR